MIKILGIAANLLLAAGMANAQSKFTIRGTVQGKTNEYIYLNYSHQGTTVNDSVMIRDGKFSFAGAIEGITQANIVMDKYAGRGNQKQLSVFLESGEMQLSVDYKDFSNSVLTGSPAQDEINKLENLKAPVMARLKPLNDAYMKANMAYNMAMRDKLEEARTAPLKAEAERTREATNPLRAEISQIEKEFMDNNPASFATANILRSSLSRMPFEEAEMRYNRLPAEAKNSSLGESINASLAEIRTSAPGATAHNFTSTELRGGPLSLSDFRGEYVLIDFWASWCVPCRKGNPHLLDLYAKYKDKGFEIIGISDDDGKPEVWKKAVEEDKIGVWKHILRGYDQNKRMRGEKNPNDITEFYNVGTLPTKILVGPDGKIVARYGSGGGTDADMDQKLAEIFGF